MSGDNTELKTYWFHAVEYVRAKDHREIVSGLVDKDKVDALVEIIEDANGGVDEWPISDDPEKKEYILRFGSIDYEALLEAIADLQEPQSKEKVDG